MNEFFDDLAGFGWESFRQQAKLRPDNSKHSSALLGRLRRIPRRAHNAGAARLKSLGRDVPMP